MFHAERPAILIEVFHAFSQSLEENSGIISRLRHTACEPLTIHFLDTELRKNPSLLSQHRQN